MRSPTFSSRTPQAFIRNSGANSTVQSPAAASGSRVLARIAAASTLWLCAGMRRCVRSAGSFSVGSTVMTASACGLAQRTALTRPSR
jgi:hypothetical protein